MDSNIANPPLPNPQLRYASCNPLPSSSVAPVTQPDYLGPTTHPAIELGPPRQKRRLEYVKCDFCRRSKKKCEPSERQWPGEKCQRCIEKGFTCSAPTKKNGDVPDALSMANNSSLESSKQGFLHEQRAYCALAEKCIQQMCSGLSGNICKLSSTNPEIDAIPRTQIDDALPEELQYACRFWAPHLYRGRDRFLADADAQDQVYNFLTRYFLCWLEALSLLQLVYEGIDSLETLSRLVDGPSCSIELVCFVHDAKRFVLEYRTDIERFPLNIYSNALRRSRLGSMEKIHIPILPVWSDPHCPEVCGTLEAIIGGHTHTTPVRDIAFSPDGKLLATASINELVRIWSLATRNTLQILEPNSMVTTMAFSPKGNILACAVYDKVYGFTLRLWDSATGKEMQTESRMDSNCCIRCIAFSPDGKLLALFSDKIIHLRDPATGCLLRIFTHDSNPGSIAFSPDGKLLASAWADGVVKVWDPHTEHEMGKFVTSNGSNSAMVFSADGQLLVPAKFEGAIKIWDPATGIIKQKTLAGYDDRIMSTTFSPAGKLFATTSYHWGPVKIWDLTTGRVQGTLMRRSEHCDALVFSPDGNMLACTTDRYSVADSLNEDKHGVDLWKLHDNK
ncbi:hypothetical protein V496_08173 [Pseudogymnoascus sp. VKM F-4515 (FW-2607)]|nr:hypothetical protein V496_08173 [Pseudogymnoascus sp. VKM F-4515 (FW-2607)]